MKKIYITPDAQLVLFCPDHPLANTTKDTSAWWDFWKWGDHGPSGVTGKTVDVWTNGENDSWIYPGKDINKPH